jgi:hypothetical protein
LSTAAVTKNNDFSLARPRGLCAATNQPIAEGETFIGALRDMPAGFDRVDVKLTSWDAFDRTNVVAYWKMTMPKSTAKKKLFVDDTVLCDLLLKLADTTQIEKLCFRFVLALILMRKRLVVYENTRHDAEGREIWTLRLRGKDQPTFEVIDPKPTDEQIAAVKDQLAQIVNEEA